jgi:hypothetical protein
MGNQPCLSFPFFLDLKERAVPPKGRSLRADGSLFFYKGILSRIYQWVQCFQCLEVFTTGLIKLQELRIMKF